MNAVVDLRRLIRVCGMLGSSSDGEALNAARMAERIRREAGLTWEQLLLPSGKPASGQQDRTQPPPETVTGENWRQVVRFCLGHYTVLTGWEMQFCTSLSGYRAQPSRKQLDILSRLLARCRDAAG